MMLIRRYLEVCSVALGVTVFSFFVISFVTTGFVRPVIGGLVFLFFIVALLVVNWRMLKVLFRNPIRTSLDLSKILKLLGAFVLLGYSLLLIVFLFMGLPDFLQNEVGCPLCP